MATPSRWVSLTTGGRGAVVVLWAVASVFRIMLALLVRLVARPKRVELPEEDKVEVDGSVVERKIFEGGRERIRRTSMICGPKFGYLKLTSSRS